MIYQSATCVTCHDVIMVPVKVNMDAYMCGINLCTSVIIVELTAISTAEWLLA